LNPRVAASGETHLGGDEKPLLNALRWFSAALVWYGHAYLLVFHKSGTSERLGFVFSSLAGLRHVAVIAFFVISGYLVGGAVLQRAKNLDLRRYAIDRATRIYIPLIPALLLTLAVDMTARAVDPGAPPFGQAWATGVFSTGVPLDNYGFWNVVASVFSVESVIAQPMGSNGALWSLGYEWVFYFLFPAVILLATRFRMPPAGVIAAPLAVAVLWLVLHSFAAACFWLIWVFGALSRFAGGTTPTHRILSRIGAVVAIVVLPVIPLLPAAFKDLGLLVFGAALASAFADTNALRISLFPALDRALAGFSYSLYIVHVPVLMFGTFLLMRAGILRSEGLAPSLAGLAPLLGLLAVSGFVAWLFGQLFERHTPAVKSWVLRKTL
jgi:peptidoglycan/LPS O-acetylase OafA/YrhL